MVFVICALIGIAILLARRYFVGGELGGPKNSRTGSAIAMVSLWCIYIIASICQSLDVGGLGGISLGVDTSV
jgi:hypothetical protein